MKKILLPVIGALMALAFSSCSDTSTTTSTPSKTKIVGGSYPAFKARKDYRTTMTVYQDQSTYDAATPNNTKIRIDLSEQRAQLLVGPNNAVAIDTPVCTGRAAKPTPPQTYRISEKIVDKRSTIFGTTYYKGKRVHGGDRRQYRGPRDKYVGAPLPYWMRMTGGGIGMHGSNSVHRYPASSGCVRTPQDIVPKIYAKTKVGTQVLVVP